MRAHVWVRGVRACACARVCVYVHSCVRVCEVCMRTCACACVSVYVRACMRVYEQIEVDLVTIPSSRFKLRVHINETGSRSTRLLLFCMWIKLSNMPM